MTIIRLDEPRYDALDAAVGIRNAIALVIDMALGVGIALCAVLIWAWR